MNKKYYWEHDLPYNDYSSYAKRKFKNRIQKISIDAGFTCPNRDGKKAVGGCTYCNNNTFKPYYTSPKKSITQQLQEGIDFFSKKYKTQEYLAYFQAYSNTYNDIKSLKQKYSEALSVEGVRGLVIATRPDCIDDAVLDYLQELAKKYHIVLEYGVETCYDKTLKRINRGHTFSETQQTLIKSSGRGINVGIHLILGLPGETRTEILESADIISSLPFDTLKLHQLQIIKGTAMASDYKKNPDDYELFSLDEYIDFVSKFLGRLTPKVYVERFVSEVPSDMLIAPRWGRCKNFEINHKIIKSLNAQNSWQGKFFGMR